MQRTLGVICLGFVLAMSGAVGLAGSSDETRTPPSSEARIQPFETGRVTGSDLADGIAAMQEHLRRQPRDARTWASLGVAYVEQARLTGDGSYYSKAQKALARSVQEQARGNDVALAGQAALASARHDFAAALRLAEQALAVNPYQAIALSIRIDALTELGRYAEQKLALRIADRRQPGLSVLARWSYAEELRGHDARAADLLRRASADAVSSADRAYLLTLLAELDRRSGQLEQADASLATALRSVPNYVPALASRARLALARGDLHSAERDWTMVTELLPLPEYLVERGELLLHLGRRDEARAQFDVLRATERLLAGHGVNTDLETALFAADHGDPARALQAARAEWSRRRSVQVADVYAWALHVNGKDGAALRLSRRATRLGTEDALMLIHRGLIEESFGLPAAARQHLRQGLAADPGLSAWRADRARAAVRRLSSGP